MKYEAKINNQAINIQTKTKCIFINVFFHSKNGDWGALLSGYIAPPGRESIVKCHCGLRAGHRIAMEKYGH